MAMTPALFALFFTLPILSLVLCVVFLAAFIRAVKKNNLSPGSIGGEKISSYRSIARFFGIFTLVTILISFGFYGLLLYAVEHM